MNGHMDTQWGRVSIDPEVIATYAGSVAVECFGIVGMAAVNMKDGLVKLLKREPHRSSLNNYFLFSTSNSPLHNLKITSVCFANSFE